ncbi:cytochrome P450 [Streptomyces nojiriensis]|uniref:cytochrome P450 n=1 Tax=Streptomyces nojiriensis TaxID=66374 RepID=UPI0036610B29
MYDWHLRHAPVFLSADMNCYFVFGHHLVQRVLTASEFQAFHPFRRSRSAFGPSVLDSDGRPHARLRRALGTDFRPRSVPRYAESVVGDVVRGLLDELLTPGRPDFAAEFAWRLPTRVVARILGLPDDEDGVLHELMRPLVLFIDNATGSVGDTVQHREVFRAYLRRRIRDGVDPERMLARLAAEPGLTEAEVVDNAMLLLAAATETTCSGTINVIARVAGEPGLWQALRADPGLIPVVVLETLRHEPPLHVTLRYAAADVVLGGVHIPERAPIQVCIASANRDPAVFPDPHTWSLRRSWQKSIAFGFGPHHCLGSGLALLELETAVHEMCRRLAALWVDQPRDLRTSGRTFRHVRDLRLGFTLADVPT